MHMGSLRPLVVAVGLALCWAAPEAVPQAAAKELKLATFLPPTHRIVKLYETVAREIADESKGDLTIKVYAGGTLGAGPFQQYKRAVEGVADIADICHAFHAKVFARTMLTVLPGSSTSASDATARLWAVAPMLADDYKEVHNVYMYAVSQAVLTSRDKPIRNIADL
jgi:TRAP-type C4-dicarboxylate transport system substrate-binding protein